MSQSTEPQAESAATEIAPHARAFADRARKLEALPLAELAARVAEGLAGLRVSFGLEARTSDPLAALLEALPRTESARRAGANEIELTRRASAAEAELARHVADSEAELSSVRAAAAEVERRSESLKAALRERSADLAQAIARADAAERARADAARAVPEPAPEPEPVPDSTPDATAAFDLSRAVALARAQQAENVQELAQLDRQALFERLDAAARELELSRRQVRELLAELDASAAPVAVERARAQLEIDALLGDLAEREQTIESMRRDLTWRAREMDAMLAELQSTRYRLLAPAILARAERWVKAARAEERP